MVTPIGGLLVKSISVQFMLSHTLLFLCCRMLSPLHAATDSEHYDLMEVLLKHGAKVSR